ncbi:hypothetical protein FRB95_008968 [Tulasnella sp. JGI-2019a]|nr:hypothetical protein FRB95_008968 [Tulasnella sp. JGI-2019a]
MSEPPHIALEIADMMQTENYTPATWRSNPLHFVPPVPHDALNPRTKETLDWVFFVSSLNFCFWSALNDEQRYGVEWYEEGWNALQYPPEERRKKIFTGYWSLPAAMNKALEQGIPITDPTFYSNSERCPDTLLYDIFAPASPRSREQMPLLAERVAILRENGSILLERFGGSFSGLLKSWKAIHGVNRTALQLVKMVTDAFPSFRDQSFHKGRPVYFWKRPQILVAEAWAAFHPPAEDNTLHPLFFNDGVSQLTMFADYRVPQILHTLHIITYPPSLLALLDAGTAIPYGSEVELSLRGASILAVEKVREAMIRRMQQNGRCTKGGISSVLIDFWLWDMAKKVERGEATIPGVEPGAAVVPVHRTRSIWY